MFVDAVSGGDCPRLMCDNPKGNRTLGPTHVALPTSRRIFKVSFPYLTHANPGDKFPITPIGPVKILKEKDAEFWFSLYLN